MGNHNKNVKPRLKNLPPKIQISGEAGSFAGGGGNSVDQNATVDIQLMQVDLGVAAQTKVGDTVRLHQRELQYHAYYEGQLLGYVPVRYNKSLLPGSVYKSHIVKISLYGEAVVVVQVSLPDMQS